jgi:Relaxase/Mobilisation nuclease domain
MIIKSMSIKAHIGKTINYLFKNEEKLQSPDCRSITIRKNLRSRKLENVIKEFEANEQFRKYKRSDAVKLYHTVLSFHEKDSAFLNEKVLKDVTKEYMKLRGENMYIAAAHYDRGHMHVHICESGTGYMTGKANRLTKQAFRELKVAMQTYQLTKYPELKHSLPRYTKEGKQKTNEYKKGQRDTQKQTLLNCLQEAEKSTKNMTEFLAHIQELGHIPYYRSGELTGLKYDGETKFRLSRLGYDKTKLETLNQSYSEEKQQLDELDELRSRSTNGKERDSETRGRTIEADEATEEMDMDTENDYEEEFER